jgi:predicted ATP-dependent serine protease
MPFSKLEITVLAVGATLAFSFIDIWYAFSGGISRIYLADAVLELAVLAALISTRRSRPGNVERVGAVVLLSNVGVSGRIASVGPARITTLAGRAP